MWVWTNHHVGGEWLLCVCGGPITMWVESGCYVCVGGAYHHVGGEWLLCVCRWGQSPCGWGVVAMYVWVGANHHVVK